jgi:diphosphomevalonate decarboxylase
MHALFATSQPAFSYFLPDTLAALNWVSKYWESENDGPLVTMDAGPNVHLLFRSDQTQLMTYFKQELSQRWKII